MQLVLQGYQTQAVLSDAPWARGIQRLVPPAGREISFLPSALAGHHFFTGDWPPPVGATTYEPHLNPGTLRRISDGAAEWHQPATPHTRIETRITYVLVGPGSLEASFDTRSEATAYPYGYVGLFWATIVPQRGQRGMHLVLADADGAPRWRYFQGGGDCWSCQANTVLGPTLPPAAHHPDHPPTYFFAEAAPRFALPIYVVRWQDRYYSLEVDRHDVAFTNVLLATACGGPSHDVSWRLAPGERKTVRCRLTVGPWPGWQAIADRYRAWSGCIDPACVIMRHAEAAVQPVATPMVVEARADSGLALSRRLFEQQGRPLLDRLGLLDRCAVGCFGGGSQNAGLDDELSRDHMWGPYLTFLLWDQDWEREHRRLRQAVAGLADEADGVVWTAYGGALPRRTAVAPAVPFLQRLTGFEARPTTARAWLPRLSRVTFLGRRWTEQLFDAGSGEVFHDPGQQFTELWRHWTGYVPPDIHRALLARSLFRVWNAGPEYNLARTRARGDRLAFALCLARFVDEVLELAFCWNEQFVPPFKWRSAHFRALPIVPLPVREGVEALWRGVNAERQLELASSMVQAIKLLMKDLYHASPGVDEPLSTFAHAMHAMIEDQEVREWTPLEW